MSELGEELEGLKVALARRFREALGGEKPVSPAFLDVARRFLADNAPKAPPAPRATPLVADLPFPDETE